MKPVIRKKGDGWVVTARNPKRVVVVGSWETALLVAAGPTGDEVECVLCQRPMSKDRARPIGVVLASSAACCHGCVGRDPGRAREATAGLEAGEKARRVEALRADLVRGLPWEQVQASDPGLAAFVRARRRRIAAATRARAATQARAAA